MSNNSPNLHDELKFQRAAATERKDFFFALSKKDINNMPFGYINMFEINSISQKIFAKKRKLSDKLRNVAEIKQCLSKIIFIENQHIPSFYLLRYKKCLNEIMYYF